MQKIIKGIIGAIIGALLLFFVSSLFLAFSNSLNVYSIAFILIGIICGFFIGYGQNTKNQKEQKFLTFSPAKLGLAVLLAIITLFGTFMFMDVTPDSGTIYYIGIVYQWTLLFGTITSRYIVYILFPQINSQLALGGPFSWIPLVATLLWDYFLICLVLYIIRKFKK